MAGGATLPYAGGRLDREGARRRDPAWVAAQRARPDARVVALLGEQVLVAPGDDGAPRALRMPAADFDRLLPSAARAAGAAAPEPPPLVFLGVDEGGPVFAADLPAGSAPPGGAAGAALPAVAALLPAGDAALLAHARAILGWHRRHRFCANCGGATAAEQGGHVRRCASPACGAQHFPRTDPAVIMLVERAAAPGRERACLLARHRRVPATRMYSTLAGFVEPGESLEEAVAREVLEETGVRVADVRYEASQPWPFPASLMIGFRATATSDALAVDGEEIEDAGWFTAADVAAFGEAGDAVAPRLKPGRSSIARFLLERWLAEVTAPA